MTVSQQIAKHHFGSRAVMALSRAGVTITGLQALPDASGSFLNSETGYVINDNGTGIVLNYAGVAQRIGQALAKWF